MSHTDIKTIGIYPNTEKDHAFAGTAQVVGHLAGRARLLAPESLRECMTGEWTESLTFVGDEVFFREPDAVLVLGGDGSILRAARGCMATGIPLLGINLGRIGYMAELELDELDRLEDLLAGRFTVERRMLLEAEYAGQTLAALNEAVLGGPSIFGIVEIELYCDGKPVNLYRADGLIASTPTGSTAYSLSAGGAVVDPRMDAIILTPICSHSLNATPIVFSADSELVMRGVGARDEQLYLSIDGLEPITIGRGEAVHLRRSRQTAAFIRLKDGGFYEILRRKMAEHH